MSTDMILEPMIQRGIEGEFMTIGEAKRTDADLVRQFLTGWIATNGISEDAWVLLGILANRTVGNTGAWNSAPNNAMGEILEEILLDVEMLMSEMGLDCDINEIREQAE